MTIDKLRAAVGWTYREREDVVERRHLRAFRHAIGEDPDDETVPPTFTACFPGRAARRGRGSAWAG